VNATNESLNGSAPADLPTGQATPSSPVVAPLRAPLAFRVGVVGHRPDRLRNADLVALRNQIHGVLTIIKEVVGKAGEPCREPEAPGERKLPRPSLLPQRGDGENLGEKVQGFGTRNLDSRSSHPGPTASQDRHGTVAPEETIALRIAVTQEGERTHASQFDRAGRLEVYGGDERSGKACGNPYSDCSPRLRALSPLAEGSDRVFAEAALDAGFELCCVMPFAQAEFEKDFAPGKALENDSLARFRGLLKRAEEESRLTRFELDGRRADERGAYSAAGRVVLNQSDLLIVVWDGRREGKRGGTEETLDAARQQGLPVVWIDAHAPHGWQILDASAPLPPAQGEIRSVPRDGLAPDVGLRQLARSALDLPKIPAENGGKTKIEDPRWNLEQFHGEKQPMESIAIFWKMFRDLAGDRKFEEPKFSVAPFEEAVVSEWPRDRSTSLGQMIDRLRPVYAWPDKLSVLYADRYRSAFVITFILAAVAVGLALMPHGAGFTPHGTAETICIALELATIVTILAIIGLGRKGQWHRRWIDYRLAAELVRGLRLVAPLGGARPFPQIPAHWASYGQPGATWMAWYVRAVERDLGLPSIRMDHAHLEACLGHASDLLEGQVKFHAATAARSKRIEQSLHTLGISLLALTLLACGLHLLPNLLAGIHYPASVPPLLTFCCGFFPALGAAIAGILNQGEFRRIAKRSEAMKTQISKLLQETETLRKKLKLDPKMEAGSYSQRAVGLANAAARFLIHEVLDWRVVVLDRPLTPPA
jgi:hypothetical protein